MYKADYVPVSNRPTQIRLDPVSFYRLVDIMGALDQEQLDVASQNLGKTCKNIEDSVRDLAQVNEDVQREAQRATLRRNPFEREKEDDSPLSGLKHNLSGQNFIAVIHGICSELLTGMKALQRVTRQISPDTMVLGKRVPSAPTTFEDIQLFSLQTSMNLDKINSFVEGVNLAETAPNMAVDIGRRMVSVLDQYYGILLRRHTTGGVEIHRDPIITDLALSIYENVDASGEIQDGTDPDEVSAYSIHKANALICTLDSGLVREFTEDAGHLITFIQESLGAIYLQARALHVFAQPLGEKVRDTMGRSWDKPYVVDENTFRTAVAAIPGLNPQHITYKEKIGLLTAEERKELNFRNETLSQVVELLVKNPTGVVPYVLRRKKELRDWHLEENSFFVCKIGQGNAFSGEAPGMLSVVPGSKPTVNLDEVVGSGFGEVKTFIANVKTSAKWHDLFIATSPSKRADKSNVLLVGPQGCGKTEVLRAVASNREAVGIFAQASDFLTCWKGEAEKNPKRLFEAGIRIQRESKKQVFFLIDEIDTILNGDRGQSAFGGTNLATEFQVLMDGITTYANLALWGATNHPERIPMPLIRRFARVVVVGELEQEDRITLLKQFTSFLPIALDFPEEAWGEYATMLDGAVGDIMRKVADHVWRDKMSKFVSGNPVDAERLIKHLNRDGKFQVSHFDTKARHQFQEELRPFVEVQPRDVAQAVDVHLSNVAIQQEIQTAQATYQRARQFIEGVNAR